MASRQADPSPPSASLTERLWAQRIPLHITHASSLSPSQSSSTPRLPIPPPLITTIPRFSYLSLLLPRLTAYFGLPCSSFHHEDVLLRNHAAGLLVDLYDPPLPWRLVVSDGDAWDVRDTFVNGAKEADFVRYGSARGFMSLAVQDTEALWDAVRDNDYASFARINKILLNPSYPLRNIPLRLYIPTTTTAGTAGIPSSPTAAQPEQQQQQQQQFSFKVLQALVPARLPSTRTTAGMGSMLGGGAAAETPNTLGPALRSLLPSLFPSSRDPVLAQVVMHGAPVPFRAPLEDLMREAAYPDGWLCLIVVLL